MNLISNKKKKTGMNTQSNLSYSDQVINIPEPNFMDVSELPGAKKKSNGKWEISIPEGVLLGALAAMTAYLLIRK